MRRDGRRRARLAWAWAAAALAIPVLAGCVAALPIAAGSAATLIVTKKTPVDHVVSWASGKDCSALRRARGESYCAGDADGDNGVGAGDGDERPFCYRTLGGVTCYLQPEPEETGRKPIGGPPS